MASRLLFLLLAATLVGCTRYQSRGTAPGKPTLPSPYAPRNEASTPATRSPLNMPATSTTVAPAKKAEPTEISLVPPPPREPMPPGAIVQPPKTLTDRGLTSIDGTLPPVSTPPEIQPVAFKQPGKIEKDKRPEPMAGDLPSPFAGATTTTPAAGSEQGDGNFKNVRRLAELASNKWQSVSTYEARLTRRETVGGKAQPEEEVLYRLRKEPFAVFMRNTGEIGKGREVLYNPTQFGDKMHIIVGAGDSIFLKAGRRAPSMSPDSPSVTEKSRQNIRDAGFGNTIARFNSVIEKMKNGRAKPDTLFYAGAEVRKDMPGFTLERIDQTISPRDEPLLQAGGKRLWFFDAKPDSISYGLPVLVVTFEGGREVEYYRFDRFRIPGNLTDADFDPEKMGKK